MRTLAAASLTCLLTLGGCTYSSFINKLSTKPTPPKTASSRTAPAGNTTPAPRTSSTPGTSSSARSGSSAPTVAPASVPASAIPGRAPLGIPSEEIPSPGECRVWLPDIPVERQSASGSCSDVQKKVPAGAWVLHRSVEKTNEVAVNVYRSRWPWIVSETRYFDYWTGEFLRAE